MPEQMLPLENEAPTALSTLPLANPFRANLESEALVPIPVLVLDVTLDNAPLTIRVVALPESRPCLPNRRPARTHDDENTMITDNNVVTTTKNFVNCFNDP